ncbi:MAG: HAMP domain-containing sensor histidine kinase [Flavihumibacter sp.]|nr:HAMP domain-containing sensor histidine kinase [Flavihumibacter sp.]
MGASLTARLWPLINFFKKFINAGTLPGTRKIDTMRAHSFNVLNLAGLLILLINAAFLLFDNSGSSRLQFVVCNLCPCIICLLLWWLMYKGKTTVAYLIGLTVFPAILFLMNIFLADRAVMYFQIVFIICIFYFFDSYYIIIPTSLLSLSYFTYGIYYLLEEHSHMQHRHIQDYEMLSYACALLLFYFIMYFLTARIKTSQKQITRQHKELRRMNEELKQKSLLLEERNQVLNKVFSIVSHDLRSPIEGLKMIMKSSKTEEEILNTMKDILPDFKKELVKMSNLFENLISWAKLEINESGFTIKEVDVNLVTNKVINLMRFPAANKNITIKKTITRDLKCMADSNVLEIVLRNLVSNAIKFTNEGGTVTIKAHSKLEVLFLQVCDTGIGMDDETILNVMQKEFYTTEGTHQEMGTGLGLMICRDLVKTLQGNMSIKSIKAEGTCVNIQLPVTNAITNTPADGLPQKLMKRFLKIA